MPASSRCFQGWAGLSGTLKQGRTCRPAQVAPLSHGRICRSRSASTRSPIGTSLWRGFCSHDPRTVLDLRESKCGGSHDIDLSQPGRVIGDAKQHRQRRPGRHRLCSPVGQPRWRDDSGQPQQSRQQRLTTAELALDWRSSRLSRNEPVRKRRASAKPPQGRYNDDRKRSTRLRLDPRHRPAVPRHGGVAVDSVGCRKQVQTKAGAPGCRRSLLCSVRLGIEPTARTSSAQPPRRSGPGCHTGGRSVGTPRLHCSSYHDKRGDRRQFRVSAGRGPARCCTVSGTRCQGPLQVWSRPGRLDGATLSARRGRPVASAT